MPKKLFHGSCHCGKIKFETNIDLSQDSWKCNCTFCRKNSLWQLQCEKKDLKLVQGEEFLSKYKNNVGYYLFCKNCGTMVYGISEKTEWSEEGYCIKVSALDDITVEEMCTLPIVYYNGKNDTWSSITDPEEIKTMY